MGTPGYNEGVDTVPQDAPTNVQTAVSGYSASSTAATPIANRLTWTALPDVTGYIVERALGAGGTFEEIGATTEPAYFDSGLGGRGYLLL